MSSSRSFAVVGGLGGSGSNSGAFGPHLVDALLAEGARVIIPLRSKPSSEKSSAAKIVQYDQSKPDTFIDALREANVEIVVSCVGLGGLEAQNDMARWSQQAGVKLFVPSEWSLPTDVDLPEKSYLFPKKQVHKTLKEIGLPYSLFFNGPFADDLFEKSEWTHIRDGGAMVVGTGEEPISFTTRRDVARYAAHALNTFTWDELSNSIYRLEAFRASWMDILRAYESYHHTNLSISHISYEECAEMCETGTPWLNMGRVKWDKEGSDVGTPEEVERALGMWPDWRPETLEDLVRRSRRP